jgi:hypothetical protein
MAFLEILGIGLKELVVGTVGRELLAVLCLPTTRQQLQGTVLLLLLFLFFVTYLDTLYLETCRFERHSST